MKIIKSKLNFLGFTFKEIAKGYYVDNWLNRKLGRVGNLIPGSEESSYKLSKQEIKNLANKQTQKYVQQNTIRGDKQNFINTLEKAFQTEIILEGDTKSIKDKQPSRLSQSQNRKEIENSLISFFDNYNQKEKLKDLLKSLPKGNQCGGESCVWVINDGEDVLKAVNPYYYQTNEGYKDKNVSNFIDEKILLFNILFPDTAYTLEGFDKIKIWDDIDEIFKTGFRVIVTQPFIIGESFQNFYDNFDKFKNNKDYSNLNLSKNQVEFLKKIISNSKDIREFKNKISDLIIEDLNKRTGENFKKISGVGKYESKNLIINDLHGNNIFLSQDEKGNVIFSYIDANPLLKNKK